MAKEGEDQQGEQEGQQQDPPSEEKLSVDLADVDEVDEDDKPTPESRKSRRAERRELKDTLHATQEQLRAVRSEMEELRRARQEPTQQQARPQREERSESPLDGEINQLEAHQAAIRASISNPKVSDAEAEAFSKEFSRLERRKQVLIARSVYQEAAQSPAVTTESIATVQLQQEFGEIYANPVLLAHAQAEYQALVHNQRKPENAATAREALVRLRDRIKQVTSPPSAGQRARYGAVPRSAGGQTSSGEYTPTKEQLNTARAYTQHLPELDDRERVKRWIRDVGKPAGLVRG